MKTLLSVLILSFATTTFAADVDLLGLHFLKEAVNKANCKVSVNEINGKSEYLKMAKIQLQAR